LPTVTDGTGDDEDEDRGLIGRAKDALVEVGGIVLDGVLDAL